MESSASAMNTSTAAFASPHLNLTAPSSSSSPESYNFDSEIPTDALAEHCAALEQQLARMEPNDHHRVPTMEELRQSQIMLEAASNRARRQHPPAPPQPEHIDLSLPPSFPQQQGYQLPAAYTQRSSSDSSRNSDLIFISGNGGHGSRKRNRESIGRIQDVKSPRYETSSASGLMPPLQTIPQQTPQRMYEEPAHNLGGAQHMAGMDRSGVASPDYDDSFDWDAFAIGLDPLPGLGDSQMDGSQMNGSQFSGRQFTLEDRAAKQLAEDEAYARSVQAEINANPHSSPEANSRSFTLPSAARQNLLEDPYVPLGGRRSVVPTNTGRFSSLTNLTGSQGLFNTPRGEAADYMDDTSSEGSEVVFIRENLNVPREFGSRQPSSYLPQLRSTENLPNHHYQGYMNRVGNNVRSSDPAIRPTPFFGDFGLDQFSSNSMWNDDSRYVLDGDGALRPLNGGWDAPDMDLPDGYAQLSTYANYIKNDPTKTVEEIKSLLENIRPDMEIPPENREGTPDAMVYPLMEHQKIGLAWLKASEEGKTKGGILADDMGLGKTIQALALLVSRPSDDPQCKTTLIVAPVALLKQWEREIQKKLKPEPEYRLSTYIHHGGAKKSKKFEDLAKFNVVLTTYGTIASEYKRQETYRLQLENGNTDTPEPFLLLLGAASKFYRVILDEAQCIKNKDTQSSKGCASLKAKYRLCLSGTPMQNSCDELYPLLRFLKVKPYDAWSQFSEHFSKPLKRGNIESAMKKLQALLRVVLIRRTKESQIDGKPILSLPAKEIRMVNAEFSSDEMEFYQSIESKSKIVFNKYVRAGAVGKNYSQILVLLLRLRQACCHPHLISDIEEAKNKAEEGLAIKLALELSDMAVQRIKEKENQECPVCLDVLPNPSIIIPCGHMFCSECLIQVQEQHKQAMVAQDSPNQKAKCPGCRGELETDKVIDLCTFKKVHQREETDPDVDALLEIEVDENLIYDTEDDVDEDGDLKGFIVKDEEGVTRAESAEEATETKKGKKKQGRGRTLAEVRKDASKNEKSKRKYHKHLTSRWVDSAKVTRCMEVIEEIKKNDPREKTIIFSQFTSLLDLLEVPLTKTDTTYRRYDGSMTSAKRNQALLDFQDDDSIKVLIVSLKAGNSGLNLVAASQVIIFDPFYNPFVELQAIDRAHRIGQQRPVTVHRLVVPGTVEDRVLALQDKKRALIEGALDENAQRGLGRLTSKDLGFLFGVNM